MGERAPSAIEAIPFSKRDVNFDESKDIVTEASKESIRHDRPPPPDRSLGHPQLNILPVTISSYPLVPFDDWQAVGGCVQRPAVDT